MSPKPVIEMEKLSFSYNGRPVLEDVNLTIGERDYVWIVGPNGGGKTTLMKLMLGLLRPVKGAVRVFGQSPSAARPRIGYMPQHASLDRRFPVTVMDVALMGRLGSGIRTGRYSRADKKTGLKALDQVGLFDLRNRALSELSGGEQRRLLIARALAGQPDLLLLDEPTANLDIRVERELHALLRELNDHLTVVMVSHDPAFVSGFVENVVCVNRKVHVHPTAEMSADFVNELFGASMRMVRHDRHGSGLQEE